MLQYIYLYIYVPVRFGWAVSRLEPGTEPVLIGSSKLESEPDRIVPKPVHMETADSGPI